MKCFLCLTSIKSKANARPACALSRIQKQVQVCEIFRYGSPNQIYKNAKLFVKILVILTSSKKRFPDLKINACSNEVTNQYSLRRLLAYVLKIHKSGSQYLLI